MGRASSQCALQEAPAQGSPRGLCWSQGEPPAGSAGHPQAVPFSGWRGISMVFIRESVLCSWKSAVLPSCLRGSLEMAVIRMYICPAGVAQWPGLGSEGTQRQGMAREGPVGVFGLLFM